MKTKYVCRGFISLYVNFHNNRIMWSTNCKKIAGGGKRTHVVFVVIFLRFLRNFFAFLKKKKK